MSSAPPGSSSFRLALPVGSGRQGPETRTMSPCSHVSAIPPGQTPGRPRASGSERAVSPRCHEEQSSAEPVSLSQADPLHFQEMPPFPAAPLHVAAVFCPPTREACSARPSLPLAGQPAPRCRCTSGKAVARLFLRGSGPLPIFRTAPSPGLLGPPCPQQRPGGRDLGARWALAISGAFRLGLGPLPCPARPESSPGPLVSPCPLAPHP